MHAARARLVLLAHSLHLPSSLLGGMRARQPPSPLLMTPMMGSSSMPHSDGNATEAISRSNSDVNRLSITELLLLSMGCESSPMPMATLAELETSGRARRARRPSCRPSSPGSMRGACGAEQAWYACADAAAEGRWGPNMHCASMGLHEAEATDARRPLDKGAQASGDDEGDATCAIVAEGATAGRWLPSMMFRARVCSSCSVPHQELNGTADLRTAEVAS